MENIFATYSIGEILQKYKNKELTPTEVAHICIARIKKYDPQFFAWVCFSEDSLLKQAKKVEENLLTEEPKLLTGIPVGIKDIFNTEDFPTQMGSPLWKDFTPGNDARVVYNLKRQGALIPGKTVTAEFAVHTLIDKTINPHGAKFTPGTSSSGSAVAVATGMVPAAIGTQTAGSIVRPASFCGIYGSKPSFGLIPRTAVLKTTDTLDTIGFFTMFADDLERMFESMRVRGTNYPMSNAALTDAARQNKPTNRPWKVAFVKTHTWDNAYDYAQIAMTEFVKKLSEGKDMQVEEVMLPKNMEAAHATHATIYNKTLSHYFKAEFSRSELVSPIMNELIKNGQTIKPEEYFKALDTQEELIETMDKFLQDYDVIISLSTAGEAPLREEVERPDPALMWTLTHLPVISIPQFTSPSGLPFGVQIAARKYNDYLLFNFLKCLLKEELIPKKANPLLYGKN